MPGDRDGAAVIRTFLIADVRGYTHFTQTHGDEAAARLASTFADVAQAVVVAAGGRVQELRGDEAMCVFTSPRQAVRAAVDLQRRFVEMTLADPTVPLGVGIGIDAGEAVRVKGGYRGGALNLAARLCSLATAGEILASREAVHLARRLDGLTYVDRGRVQLKGIDEPPAVVRVVPDDDPAAMPAFLAAVRPRYAEQRAAQRRRARLAAALALAAAAVLLADVAVVVDRVRQLTPLHAIGTNAVGVIDLGQSVLYERVPVGTGPGALAGSPSAVWVANALGGTVSRIDLAHHEISNTLPVGQDPSGISVGEGAVWVSAASDRVVTRIDPRSKTVTGSIQVGNGPTAVAAGAGAVWVTNSLDGTVSVVDPAKNEVAATVPVGGGPSAVAAGHGVWVANAGSATVSRIDPVSRRIVATIPVGNNPSAVAVAGDAVWVANTLDGTVTRIDAATGTVAATVRVGGEPTGLAVAGDAVWVTDGIGDRVSRVDADEDKVTRVIQLGNAPQSAVVADGKLWVSARGSGRTHRGGTLRIGVDPDVNSLDPAVGYRPISWAVETVVYDGLVTFQRVGGPGGALVVPDLARALPTVSDGGRTYTFQLRTGITFSDGTALTAGDFRRSFERMLRLGSAAGYYYGSITGAADCAGPDHDCSALDGGVEADDARRTVTIHLDRPDPELLYKLALPFASVVGRAAPDRDQGFDPLVGTGPYVSVQHPPRGHIVLRRNPRFREWSHAAQPDGFPEAIDIRLIDGDGLPDFVAATAEGRYDLATEVLTDEELRTLRTQVPTQLHPFPQPATHYMFLNTRTSPLSDVRVRRAVNLAVDRRHSVDVYGGEFFATPTCQVLPPTMSGFRPYCPYTDHPAATGTWTGPDLARARRLVAASGTRGDTVRVVIRPDEADLEQETVRALRALGYRLDVVRPKTPDDYFAYIHRPGNNAGVGVDGWVADYPAPSNFMQVLLTCASAHAHDLQTHLNPAEFCDPDIDRQIQAALDLQTTDPAAAADSWSRLDHEITDLAPWVALVNERGWDLVSERVGNYQHNPQWGALLDQMWVQ